MGKISGQDCDWPALETHTHPLDHPFKAAARSRSGGCDWLSLDRGGQDSASAVSAIVHVVTRGGACNSTARYYSPGGSHVASTQVCRRGSSKVRLGVATT